MPNRTRVRSGIDVRLRWMSSMVRLSRSISSPMLPVVSMTNTISSGTSLIRGRGASQTTRVSLLPVRVTARSRVLPAYETAALYELWFFPRWEG